MKEIFDKFNIEITKEQLEKFEKYFELLTIYNEKFNITAITEKREVYLKNFVDSVIFVDKFSTGKLIDIGSGGGFPAVPLKIMKDDLNVTMLEATGKKCEFLSVLVKELGLTNVRVINGRAEEYAFNQDFREKFDYCTARAVARLNILSEYCLPFVKVGGKMIAYKGKASEEVEEAKTSADRLGGKIVEFIERNLEDNTRSAVIIEKIKSTDLKYPRANGKIRKNPL